MSPQSKKNILAIMLEHTNHDELSVIFATIKTLIVRYGKKIYSSDFLTSVTDTAPQLVEILKVLAKVDPVDAHGILQYNKLLASLKQDHHLLTLPSDHRVDTTAQTKAHEHIGVVYRQGDTLYKRSLERDLEKMLAKK